MTPEQQLAQRQIYACKQVLGFALTHTEKLIAQGVLPPSADFQALAIEAAVQEMVKAGMSGELISFVFAEYAAEHPEWKLNADALDIMVFPDGSVKVQPRLPFPT